LPEIQVGPQPLDEPAGAFDRHPGYVRVAVSALAGPAVARMIVRLARFRTQSARWMATGRPRSSLAAGLSPLVGLDVLATTTGIAISPESRATPTAVLSPQPGHDNSPRQAAWPLKPQARQ